MPSGGTDNPSQDGAEARAGWSRLPAPPADAASAAPRTSHAPGLCSFCGLPVAIARRRGAPPTEPAPAYCCFGCEMAESILSESRRANGMGGWNARIGFAVFFSMNVVGLGMVLWTQDQAGASAGDDFAPLLWSLLRYGSLLLTLPVAWLLGRPLFATAWQRAARGLIGMDALLAAGVGAALACSVFAVVVEKGHVYFEIVCVVLLVATIGKWLEAQGKVKACAALAELQDLLPAEVTVVESDGLRTILSSRLRAGQTVQVRAGACVPCDGFLASESAEVDESFVTGESVAVVKQRSDAVSAGSFAVGVPFEVVAAGPVSEGTLARLIEAVRSASEAKSRHEALADRVSMAFVPAVAVIAVLAGAWHGAHSGLEAGFKTSLAVIAIACPCALGLAMPLAYWAARGLAARRGVIFRGDAIERLANVAVFRFDKTGTLTTGKPTMTVVAGPRGAVDAATINLAARLAAQSAHPFARAIAALAPAAEPIAVESVEQIAGRGLKARIDGCEVALGSLDFLGALLIHGGTSPNAMNERGDWLAEFGRQHSDRSMVGLAMDGRVAAAFAFAETIRPQAAAALAALRDRGCDLAVLTGDRPGPAALVAEQLNIACTAELRPAEKAEALEQARDFQGRRRAVAFVGDGINDGPALAAADVGIALGCGTDLSRAAADVCLLGNDLNALPWLLELAQRTMHVARQNLFWAFVYNVVGMGLAAAGVLHPIVAALAMAASSVMVIANSMRLRASLLGAEPAFGGATARSLTARSPVESPLAPTPAWQGGAPCWNG